ncbi:hypothetical protein [Halococcus sp. IIIV-5B]|uniref:hypothetical protein n=1 Tax=Halococcus sp. IIIV-5B TaxID=2321230 RepID=UPI001313E63E|nr:hypothetical protein [Halococcus sp. IIIV-5B]
MDTIVIVVIHIVVPKLVGIITIVPAKRRHDAVQDTRIRIATTGIDVGVTIPNVVDGPNPITGIIEHTTSPVVVSEISCHRTLLFDFCQQHS